MTSPFRRALLALVVFLGCRKDADPTEARPQEDAAAMDEAVPEGPTPPDLSQHAFPLLVWSAFEVQTDYFDPARIDPRGQLVAAAEALGEHTPEFLSLIHICWTDVVRSGRSSSRTAR